MSSLFLLIITALLTSNAGALFNNLTIKNCETYPYYNSQRDQLNGNETLFADFQKALLTMKQCQKTHSFSPYVQNKFNELSKILTSNQVKTLTCNYGVTNSYYAVATTQFEEQQGHGLPPHPSIIFDTNRMAGNFPVQMNQTQRENFVLFSLSRNVSLDGKYPLP